ncbi:hypothetical protein [Sigmofec virus UA08Rod_4888]|uniref:Uncharacterized protein n=1 Tax=Sigmofec virus UA08Rod_4888 TaxID=2929412 RepID=A0A976N1B3_9VIRU|nr:hypothetical protein [Sigmofec virus UA08Rod_4888]
MEQNEKQKKILESLQIIFQAVIALIALWFGLTLYTACSPDIMHQAIDVYDNWGKQTFCKPNSHGNTIYTDSLR